MRYFIEAVLNPFFLALLLLWMATLLVLRSGKPRLAGYCLVVAVLMLSLCSTAWLPATLGRYLEKQYPVVRVPQADIAYVVVLSGGQSREKHVPANMQLNGSSQQRLWEGLRLLHQLPKATLIVSGGGYNPGEKPEALQMAQLTQWCQIDSNRVLMEKRSLNTYEQAIELYQMIGTQPFYLVTSAMHMPRSMYSMRKLGMHPIAAPTDFIRYWHDERWSKRFIPNPYNLVYSTIILHELLGRLYYAL
ncbi:MAG: YdcF family protein [Legionellaceae bacterium]|nr:YdcF family protein [Legionellaceae bacterium]